MRAVVCTTSVSSSHSLTEMERSRVTLTALIYVSLFSQRRINGAEMEMKVRPGDNITLYCDHPLTHGSHIVWIRNCSHEHQPSLIIDQRIMYEKTIPHFSFLQSSSINSFDLHITNITVSDLGLYYCAEFEKKLSDKTGILLSSEEYKNGNRTTRVSFTETSCSGASSTVSSPHFLCWTLLVSVCSVCVLLCCICVYCLCLKKTTDAGTKTQGVKIKRENLAEGDDEEVCYTSVTTRRQKRRKKKQLQTSDFSTYAQVRTETTQNF